MLKRIKRLLGIGVHPKPLKKDGPFERAAAEVSLLEAADRARWEERERRWRAKSRAIHGPKAWNTALGDAIQQDLDGMHAKEQKTNREIASGIVIDPGGTCLCRRCGHTVSAVSDRCIQCYNKLDWSV